MDQEFKPLFAEVADSWHNWFAWRPVNTVDAGLVWLLPVQYRACVFYTWLDPVGGNRFFQYKRHR